MPLTVRKFDAQVKDPKSGQMIPAGLLSSDSLEAIDAAKNSAVTAIQEKGEQTKATIPDDYTALSDRVGDLEESLDTYVMDRFENVDPVNWWNDSAATLGVLSANGTVTESTTKCYSDYIPVIEGDVIRYFYRTSDRGLVRRNVCCYDSNKNVLTAKGTDSAGQLAWTVPSDVSYIRITIDATYREFAVITKNVETVTAYVAYFEPYVKIIEDFLTDESKQAIDSIKNQSDNYGYAMPMGADLRLTVGIPEKWYYKSMLSPDCLITNLAAGQAYSQRENDGVSFPADEPLSSSNGYAFSVFDTYLNTIYTYTPNSGYGLPRHIVAENLQDCSALVIGDSTVDFDTMTQSMLDHFSAKSKTLTLLGTLGSGLNRNEGRAGWKAQDYLTNKTYDGVTNPFYNPTSGTFDFAYYMNNQGYAAPDFVVIQLGINDLYNSGVNAIEPTWAAIKTIIDSIISYNSAIKILLNLPTTPNSDQSKHPVFLPLYQNRVVRYNQYAQSQAITYGTSKVRCTYCHLILNPATDIRDNVHPTNAGFEKMALEVINQINCWQNGV